MLLSSIILQCPKTPTIFGEIFYPGLVVEILLQNHGYQPFEFILDSGADCTMVPKYIASLVGFNLPDVPDTDVAGIAGSIPAYKGSLSLRIQQESFKIRCLITESDRTPFLLGRLDFFCLFDVSFAGTDCQIILKRR